MTKDKAEKELAINIKKATNADETAPKEKHVRKCIAYTWDHHSSISFWSGLHVQPILSNEVQAFKALIMVHTILQEGHPVTIKDAQGQTGWLETCSRTISYDGGKGYGPLIHAYVQLLLAKLRFHRLRPEFNWLFEYEEYVTLKGTDNPNVGYEIISELMRMQDQIKSFQKLIFSHFRASTKKNECCISSLMPLVKESWGIYRFITGMLRDMYQRANDIEALEPLRQRYNMQHHSLRKFYYECSNPKYLTGLTNVPKLGQAPPNLIDNEGAPDSSARPTTAAISPMPQSAVQAADETAISEQARLLRQYKDQQAALRAQQRAERRRRQELELQQRPEFEQRQPEQQERERLALEASPSQPGGSSLPTAATAGATPPTRPRQEPSSSSSPHTRHSYPHFPSISMPFPPGFRPPMPSPAAAFISAPAAGPSFGPAPAAASPPLPFPAPSQTQEAVRTDRAQTESERWDRMDVLYQSIRNNMRQFEYPAASVAALESVLVRMYFESPLSASHPEPHPAYGAPTVPLAQAAPQLPPPEYTAIYREGQSDEE